VIVRPRAALAGHNLGVSMARGDDLERRERLVFLCLILTQGAHSIEEYATGLYAVFPPARFVSSLISHNLAMGFLLVNAALVTFGLWCWAVPVRSRWPVAGAIVWFWTLLELGNGIGHLFLALSQRGYFPGIATAPFLLFFAGWLVVLQARQRGGSSV
jgi:hypothetical protein